MKAWPRCLLRSALAGGCETDSGRTKRPRQRAGYQLFAESLCGPRFFTLELQALTSASKNRVQDEPQNWNSGPSHFLVRLRYSNMPLSTVVPLDWNTSWARREVNNPLWAHLYTFSPTGHRKRPTLWRAALAGAIPWAAAVPSAGRAEALSLQPSQWLALEPCARQARLQQSVPKLSRQLDRSSVVHPGGLESGGPILTRYDGDADKNL